jgi:chromosome partitioning protein
MPQALKIPNLAVLLLAGTKGGTSKTSNAQAFAVAAKLAGHRVLVLDLDPIGAISKWNERRRFARASAEAKRRKPNAAAAELAALIEDIEEEPPDPWDITVTSIQPHAIREALRIAKRNGVTFVVIDVAGSKHNYAEEAAKFADLVLIPAKPITKELEHLPETKAQLALAGQPPFFVLFNRVHPQATTSLEQPRRIAHEYYNATPFPYHFTYRPAVWETADDLGLTPQELGTDPEAKAEIERAFRFISEFLNIERGEERGKDGHAGATARTAAAEDGSGDERDIRSEDAGSGDGAAGADAGGREGAYRRVAAPGIQTGAEAYSSANRRGRTDHPSPATQRRISRTKHTSSEGLT